MENPYLNILIGVILLYSGFSEAWHEFGELKEITIGAHHGIILFSILHILKAVPEIFEGLEYLQK